jgi:hypothetical protein
MVSIRKYLDMRAPRTDDSAAPRHRSSDLVLGTTVLSGLCSKILNHIGTYVFGGDSNAELRAALVEARAPLDAGNDAEFDSATAANIANTVRAMLVAHAARDREASQRASVDAQHVVGVLNYALMAISGGSLRSLSRLERVQESLQQTVRRRDVEGLRASLTDAMKLIREEATREKEHAERDLASVESEVVKVRERLAAKPGRGLPGRSEAIQALSDVCISDTDTVCSSDLPRCLVAFSFDNIRVIQRYSPEQVEELFFQVIRERVYPLAAVNSSWRWCLGGIVSVFERDCTLPQLQSDLAELCRAPLVCRMTTGSGTTVINVSVSHLEVMLSSQALPSLIEQIDRFCGVQ